MSEQAVGFIGLGQMGVPMARRLLQHGWEVRSSVNQSRAGLEALAADGIVECASPAEAAAGAGCVITMLRDTEETRAVALGEGGVLAAMAPGATLITMSTIDPGFCRALAAEAGRKDVAALDVPVSGFPFRAAEGSLALMAGGEAAAIERCRPLLEVMGTVLVCGGPGMGQVAKLANNAAFAATAAGLIEARAFAEAQGMSGDRLLEILGQATANSFAVQNWAALQPMWDHVVGLLAKDVAIFAESAGTGGVAIPVVEVTARYPWPTRD